MASSNQSPGHRPSPWLRRRGSAQGALGDVPANQSGPPASPESLIDALAFANASVVPPGRITRDNLWAIVRGAIVTNGLDSAGIASVLADSMKLNPANPCSRLDFPTLAPLCDSARQSVTSQMNAPRPKGAPPTVNAFDIDPVAIRTEMASDLKALTKWRDSLLALASSLASSDVILFTSLKMAIDAFLPIGQVNLCPSGYVSTKTKPDPKENPDAFSEAFGFLLPMVSPPILIGNETYYAVPNWCSQASGDVPGANTEYPQTGARCLDNCVQLDTNAVTGVWGDNPTPDVAPVNPTWWRPYFKEVAKLYSSAGMPDLVSVIQGISVKADVAYPQVQIINGSGIYWEALLAYRSLRDALGPLLEAHMRDRFTSVVAASTLRTIAPLVDAVSLIADYMQQVTGCGTPDCRRQFLAAAVGYLDLLATTSKVDVVAKMKADIASRQIDVPSLPGFRPTGGSKTPVVAFTPISHGTGPTGPTGPTGGGTMPLLTTGPTRFPLTTTGNQRLPTRPIYGRYGGATGPTGPAGGGGGGGATGPAGGGGATGPTGGGGAGHGGGGGEPVRPSEAMPPATGKAASGHRTLWIALGITAAALAAGAGTVAVVRVQKGKPALPKKITDPLGE